MRFQVALVAALMAGATLAACAAKQTRTVQGVEIAEDKAGLWQQATLPADSAMKIALARVPGGRVVKGELEEEDGRLIYSFDIEVGGKEGTDEVHVDARTGAVVAVKHESE
jgi:uncharacterized membrane protein YkoI